MKPFLKWAGGKRWLPAKYPELFKIEFSRYVEPFLGGGSIFLHLEPKASTLSDANPNLINLYQCIKQDHSVVSQKLREHAKRHNKDYYYSLRSKILDDRYDRAAQFLYLNRTCWNGLYRENRKGQFNVPKGTKDSVLFEDDDFAGVSKLLKRAKLKSGDFADVLATVKKDDFVFIDPPYTVKHNTNGFVKYNETIFSWEDQLRLADLAAEKSAAGASIIVCNAFHESILDLYSSRGTILKVNRASVLSGDARFRGTTEEAVILLGSEWHELIEEAPTLQDLIVEKLSSKVSKAKTQSLQAKSISG